MKNLFIIFLILLSGCGKLPDLSKKMAGTSNVVPKVANIVAGPYSPAQYFKILSEVDSNSDTRIYEFYYRADGTFLILQKNYPAGNLSSGFFHKTSGTYSEDKTGTIIHSIGYDSCGDMSSKTASFKGDSSDMVSLTMNGNTISLYSQLSWTYPHAFLSAAIPVEDVGCVKFPKL